MYLEILDISGSNAKSMENLVFGPQWAHICTAKELRIEFLALTYPFIETSNHTILPQEVTCFHMSKVICLPSWISLYLHLELSWIWVEWNGEISQFWLQNHKIHLGWNSFTFKFVFWDIYFKSWHQTLMYNHHLELEIHLIPMSSP